MSSAELLMVKGAISELSPEEQFAVNTCAATLRNTIIAAGAAGTIAMALVSVEMAAAEYAV